MARNLAKERAEIDLMLADIDVRATLAAIATTPKYPRDAPIMAGQFNQIIDMARHAMEIRDRAYRAVERFRSDAS